MQASQLGLFEEPTVSQALPPFTGKIIYETKGRAREYRELACNLYTGCAHGCVYCYSPDVLCRKRESFFGEPKPRPNVLAGLARDAWMYGRRGEGRQVLFCFACDPYQPIDVEHKLTREAINICHREGLSICTLTKGGRRALRDIDLFTTADSFATTLTTLDDAMSLEWESGAALPLERIDTLWRFHEAGIPTWVSLEPVIDPEITKEIIQDTHAFVDEYKVGRLNYHPRAKEIDWPKFAREVVELLESLGCRYYVKEDLRKLLP